LLVNPSAGCYHDANGIHAKHWPCGSGSYPLNWLISPHTVMKMVKEKDEAAYREKWTNIPFLNVMGGEDTILPVRDDAWAIGYKKNTNERSVQVLQAVQMDDSRGTFIEPDWVNTEEKMSANYTIKLGKSRSNKPRCRRYVENHYHVSPFDCSKALLWDPDTMGDADFRVWVMQQEKVNPGSRQGPKRKDNGKKQCPYTTTRVSVRKTISESSFLRSCNNLGQYNHQSSKTSVRAGDIGKMYPVGVHVAQGDNRVSQCREHNDTNFCKHGCNKLCHEAAECFDKYFPCQLSAMRQAERAFNVQPGEEYMGGSEGVTCSIDQSVDLANPSHFDPFDASIAISTWTELFPGNASNWYFIMPNIEVFFDGKKYEGLYVKLSHGTSISWDGRLIRHCTSITHLGKPLSGNHVFGTFWAAKTHVVEATLTEASNGIEGQATGNLGGRVVGV
jgi:hypothetical protein